MKVLVVLVDNAVDITPFLPEIEVTVTVDATSVSGKVFTAFQVPELTLEGIYHIAPVTPVTPTPE